MTPTERPSIFPPMPSQTDQAASGPFDVAREWLRAHAEMILEHQLEVARCPAPPFHERARGELVSSKLEQLGLKVEFDDIGNLLAHAYAGDEGDRPPIVLAAHLDTVFGPDVAIEIRRDGDRWIGPGVSDNARGIAICLALARALVEAKARADFPLVFAFTVGEEGSGDLRGVKHLFRPEGELGNARAFIAVDGGGLRRIICTALGSRRYRITIRGPGGHSWTDWGRANPAVVTARLVARAAELHLPQQPRTTLTAARHGGGTSINAIPSESWVEIDLRSESRDMLDSIEALLRAELDASLSTERAGHDGELEADWQLIGERPAARMSASDRLVTASLEATRSLGVEPKFAVSSTDANVPMALGVPAIAVGGGGRSGDTHTLHEWFEDRDGPAGALRLLNIIHALADT